MFLNNLNKYMLILSTIFVNLFAHYFAELDTNEIITQGRVQYQLLRERGSLPKYGSCWKSAIEQVDEGCRNLSDDSQSHIALKLTNCFLEMSGHETYRCVSDRKPNVRRICISSMSDRAFNVYTEFYTHTLNMCWFLRGQIWQEAISENTLKVGKQLAMSAEKQEELLEIQQESYKQLEHSSRKQEKLLEIQRESLDVQEKMLGHGKFIESVLNDLTTTTRNHQDMLLILSQTVNSLQSWIVGEVSWLNSVIFYVTISILSVLFTSTSRTIISRLPILSMIIFNLLFERFLCYLYLKYNVGDAHNLFTDLQYYIWVLRYFLIISSCTVLVYKAYHHQDMLTKNQAILSNIARQNEIILNELKAKNESYDSNLSIEKKLNGYRSNLSDSFVLNVKSRITPSPTPSKDSRYNLRSRQGTPISVNV